MNVNTQKSTFQNCRLESRCSGHLLWIVFMSMCSTSVINVQRWCALVLHSGLLTFQLRGGANFHFAAADQTWILFRKGRGLPGILLYSKLPNWYPSLGEANPNLPLMVSEGGGGQYSNWNSSVLQITKSYVDFEYEGGGVVKETGIPLSSTWPNCNSTLWTGILGPRSIWGGVGLTGILICSNYKSEFHFPPNDQTYIPL